MKITEEQMVCLQCGYIAKPDAPYYFEETEDTEYAICPNCGEWNIGGYSSFAPWNVWAEDEQKTIKSFHLIIH